MAYKPSTAAKTLKKKFKLPSFRGLVKPTKSINDSPSQSILDRGASSSTCGAHNAFLGNDTESSQPIASNSTAPLQSARPPLWSIQDLPASTIREGEIQKPHFFASGRLNFEEANRESSSNLTSTTDPVSRNSQAEAPDRKAPAKESLKVAGNFLQTLLKKAPEYADANPVKIALSIIRTIIEIKDAVGDNKDGFAQGLQETETILQSLKKTEVFSVAEVVKQDVEKFKQEISKEKKNLEELAGKLLIAQILDYEEYKKEIGQIFQRIKRATTSFQLAMTINIQIQVHDDSKKVALKRLNPSAMADHRTFLEHQTLTRVECTVGTRVRILEQITDWVNDHSSNSPRVFWLTGQAGSGKTTIAYTIAKRLETAGNSDKHVVLGANFFCSRQFSETQSQTRIVPTIAYQLAHKCRLYADALHVADKFDTVNHDVSIQMKDLLFEPWQQFEATRRPELPIYVIVIDALDEIEGKGGSAFLRNLLLAIDEFDLQCLKFLVTSRSDPELVKLCEAFTSRTVCRLQDVPIEEAKSDIDTYLEDKLPKLAGSPHLAKVGQQAGGLFIYAATVVRYLTADDSVSATEQTSMLKDLLSKSDDDASDATFLIDILYRQIMHDTFWRFKGKHLTRRLHILYTFLCTAERTSTSTVAALVADGDNEAAGAVLDNLHAVLYTQNNQVFWYHASFPDFIFDKARSNFRIDEKDFVFSCDEQAHHHLLAQSCFRMMECCLRFNMGDIPSSFLFDRDNIATLSERVNQNVTPVLRYSCGYWAHHLPSLQIDTNILCSYISDFLQIRVLFWIEVMNLLGLCNQCTLMLQSARQWVLKWTNNFLELARNVAEAANFATHFTGSPAAESTPHLYISALATWSQDSGLSRNWKKHFSRIPVFTHTTSNDVNLPLMTIQAESAIFAVAFSSDGTQIVSGCYDKSVRVWDASTGAELKVLNGHTSCVNSVAFSSDSRQIVSGCWDKSVRVWDASTGAEQKVLNGHTNWVTSVAFSSDGTQIVSGSLDNSVRVWDVSTSAEQKVLNGHTDVVKSVAFSNNGMRIVTGSSDKSVRVWDVLTGTEQRVLNGHTGPISSVAFSSDGMRIVSGSSDKSVRVWDVSTGAELKVLNGHLNRVSSVAFSSDSTRIVSGSFDKSVRVWDASMGAELKVLNGHKAPISSVAFSSNGMRVVSGSSDKSVRVWDVSTSVERKALHGHTDIVESVAFSTGGMRNVFGPSDKSVHMLDTSTGVEKKVLNGHINSVIAVAFSSNGMQIVSGSDDNSVRVWDASTGAEQKVLNGHTDSVNSVAISGDGMQIVSGSNDSSVRVWDMSTGAVQKVLNGHTDVVNSTAFSSDDTWIVSGSSDKSVRVWDVSTGAEWKVLNGHTDFITSVAFSSDSMRIVSGSGDESVRIWDASTGVEQKVLNGHTKPIYSVAFSSDGTRIVSGSYDQSVWVWDASTGAVQKVLNGHTDCVNSVAFSSNGMRIVSGSHDKSVRVWDVSTPNNDFVWDLTKENWIISFRGKDHLMWVPPAAGLPRPANILVISRSGSAAVDFSQAKLGSDWVYCYTPI